MCRSTHQRVKRMTFNVLSFAFLMSAVEHARTSMRLVDVHVLMCCFIDANVRGFAKLQKFQEGDNFGSGWVGPGLTRKKKELDNLSRIVLYQYWYCGVVHRVYFVCKLLQVVCHCHLSVLAMSLMVWVLSIHFILEILLTLKALPYTALFES